MHLYLRIHFSHLKTRIILLSLVLGCLVVIPAWAANHAVILVYHHVSNDMPASTSVSIATFEKHLTYLQKHNFTVMPLERMALS
jgi:hypothetical protein